MVYRLKFYDNFYQDYRIAYEFSLFELLMNWGLWMDISNEWYIHKMPQMDSYKMTLIGRSAKEAE